MPSPTTRIRELLAAALEIVTLAVHEHAHGPLGPDQKTDPGWEGVGQLMERLEPAIPALCDVADELRERGCIVEHSRNAPCAKRDDGWWCSTCKRLDALDRAAEEGGEG